MSDLLNFPFNPSQPGGYSTVDTSALDAADEVHGPIVAVIGDTRAGKPNTALLFKSTGALRNRLRGGDAYDAARLAMLGGGRPVMVVRAGAPTQGAITLAGTGSTITFTSNEYGAIAANIKLAVAANNKVTVTFADPDSGQLYAETFACGTGATGQKIADTINGKIAGISGSAFGTAVAATPGAVAALTVVSATALSGASDGSSLVSGDYTTALAVLEAKDVSIIVAATSDATVHAQVKAHCDAMSAVSARHERTMLYGGALAESVSAVSARQAALGSPSRAQQVYPGVKLLDATGTLKTYPSYITAGLIAGRHVSRKDAATSLIHDRLPVIDVEVALSRIGGGDVDTLLAANVSPITAAKGGGFWLVDSLSGSTDNYWRDFHKQRTADAVSARLRDRLEDEFVGGKSLTATEGSIGLVGDKECEAMVTEQLLWAAKPLQVERSSDAKSYLVTAPVLLPEATKFILLVVALQPPSTAGSTASIPDGALA